MKIVRLTETDLTRLVSKIINEQNPWAGNHYRDSTYVTGNDGGWLGNLGKRASLNDIAATRFGMSCGSKYLPQGNINVAKQLANSFAKAVKGVDIMQTGQNQIVKNIKSMQNMSLIDFNEVLKQYCVLSPKGLYNDLKSELGLKVDGKKGQIYTKEQENWLLHYAKTKIEAFCGNYSNNKTFTDEFNKRNSSNTQPNQMEIKFCSTMYKYQ
jgi:hypothetical protein